jgi:hypothetical protein
MLKFQNFLHVIIGIHYTVQKFMGNIILAMYGRFLGQCVIESMSHIGAVPDDKFF